MLRSSAAQAELYARLGHLQLGCCPQNAAAHNSPDDRPTHHCQIVYTVQCVNNVETVEKSSLPPLEAKSALSKIMNFGVSWGCLEGVWGCLEGVCRVSKGFCILSSVY